MITRKLNERITFFERSITKDENGDLVKTDKDLFSCWCEISKATTKEFRDRANDKIEEIQKRRNKRTMYIRFRKDIQSEMLLKWRDTEYKVIDTEEDWKSKDMLMLTVEAIE